MKRAILLGILLGLLINLGYAVAAHAQTPQLGTCTASGQTCFAPAVAISVASYNFTTRDIAAGVTPQVGYGITYHALIDVGAAIYLGASVGQGQPNNMNMTVLGDVANWLRFGPGVTLIQGGSAQFLFFIGTGSTIGGSTAYVKAAALAAKAGAQ